MACLFYGFHKLSYKLGHQDEPWEYTEEPHSSRRRQILKKYPEIKKLMGPDPMVAYVVTLEVVLQVVMCYLMQDAPWWKILLCAYVIGASLNHSLGSAIHEIGHNLAFGHTRPLWNRALGIFCNLPMAVPISVTYKKYHSLHHRYLGHDQMDVDVPTKIECLMFRHTVTKIIWLILHPMFHGVRPLWKVPLRPNSLEMINLTCQIIFNATIYYAFGLKGLLYLMFGTAMGLGFHPLAGHFLSEHYLFKGNNGEATYSYYGPLNAITFNVGYHVEHHDFPYIPYRRLPQVRKTAKEFYEDLPYHTSWLKVLWDFITDPHMGPKARGVGYITNHNVSKLAQ